MKTDETTADEASSGQRACLQTLVISIAHNKTRKDKKEVDGKETMVEPLLRSTVGKGTGLEKMLHQHTDGSDTSQAVENFVTCFHGKILDLL